ncbi:hypothetical protein [Paractinoplanes toevensis]|nr:hypothetical protein [Actinoplanes toevensis]
MPLLLVAALAGGCSDGDDSPVFLTAPADFCPQAGVSAGPEREPLAADFVPVSAVACNYDILIGSRASPGTGGRWVAARRATGSLDGLVAALRTPPPTGGSDDDVCMAMYQVPVFVALTDANGRTVLPAVPGTPCGFRLGAVDTAIEALTWTEIR